MYKKNGKKNEGLHKLRRLFNKLTFPDLSEQSSHTNPEDTS